MYNTTVVIPCINSEDVIEDCIKSLNSKTVSIYIIDNGSNDKTLLKIEKLNYNVKIFQLKKNLGWGNAANFGISKVKTKYALLINPDIKFVTKNPISKFEKQIKLYSNIGMATAITLDQNLKPEDGRLTFYSKIKKNNLNNIKKIPEGHTCSTFSCVYGGAIIFFDVKKFKRVDGFDKNCFLYLEEDDLCYRMKQANFLNVIFPSIKAIHSGSLSSKIPNLTWWKNWHWAWSEFYFKKKYFGNKIYFKIVINLFKWSIKTTFYFILDNKKYYLYSGRLNGAIKFILGKKAMNNLPSGKLNNAKGIFGNIRDNPNENYTLSK
jgi:N-acetylglucosaminyl-diphospho-decaprenol L-rhamnosyltransferase